MDAVNRARHLLIRWTLVAAVFCATACVDDEASGPESVSPVTFPDAGQNTDHQSPPDSFSDPGLPQVSIQVDPKGLATCQFSNRNAFGEFQELKYHWQRADGGPFVDGPTLQLEPCEWVICWVSINHNGQTLQSDETLARAKINWCDEVWETPNFSAEVTPHVTDVPGDIRTVLRFGVPVETGKLASVGACRVVCGNQVHPTTCHATQFWSPGDKHGIKWISALTALPSSQADPCVLELLEEAPPSQLNPLAKTLDNGELKITTPLLTTTVSALNNRHVLTNLGITGNASARLRLQNTTGQWFEGRVTERHIVENNSVATIIELKGHYVPEGNPGGAAYHSFNMTLTALRSIPYLGVEHRIIFSHAVVNSQRIKSMTLELEHLGKVKYVDLSGNRLHLNPDHVAQSVFNSDKKATLTLNQKLFHSEKELGCIAVSNQYGTLGIAVKNPHLEYPKVLRYTPATTDQAARVVFDMWPTTEGDLGLSDPHPFTLQNSGGVVNPVFCVGPQGKSLNWGHTTTLPCVDWLQASNAQKVQFIDALALRPATPIVVAAVPEAPSNMDDLLSRCGSLCDNRRIIYDEQNAPTHTAQGTAKTQLFGLTFKSYSRRLTIY